VKSTLRDSGTARAGGGAVAQVSESAVLILVSCCVFVSVLNTNMFNVALPQIGRDFALTAGGLGWVVTSYSLIFGMGTPFYGRLAEKYGLRRMFMIGLAIFSLGSVLSAIAPTYPLLIVGRVIQAAGTAAIPALGTASIFRVIPPERRGTASGYISAMVGVGSAIGPSLGGALTELIHWRALFVFGALLAIAVPLSRRILPEDEPGQDKALDLPSGFALGFMIAGVLIAVTNLEDFGPLSPWVLGPLFVAALSFLVLRHRILHGDDPFIPKDLLQNRHYRMLVFIGFAMLLTHVGTLVTVPLLLDGVNNLRPAQIGLVLLPSAIMMSVTGPLAGRLTDRIGALRPMRVGVGITLATMVMMSTIGAGGSAWLITGILLLKGIGAGIANPTMINSVSFIVPKERIGMAISLYHMTFFLGGAFGATLITSMIDFRLGADQALNLLHSGVGVEFSDAFLVPVVICGIAFVLTFLLRVPKPWEVDAPQR
jgi:MFS transporter, DHA2 family, metal-tetracycline-proton antiporter